MQENKKVYAAINAVQSDLSKEGISKDSKNEMQHYKFRGIDAVYNALASLLAKHKLCILPRVLSRSMIEKETKSGGSLFFTTVDVEFDFVSAEDSSLHTIRTCGEAMDSSDKSTNKAMSAAYKYACLQTFCIPTEGDNDADAKTPEPAAAAQPQRKSAPPAPAPAKPATPPARAPERKSETDKYITVKGKVADYTKPTGKRPHSFNIEGCSMELKTFDEGVSDCLLAHMDDGDSVEVTYEMVTRGTFTNAMIVDVATNTDAPAPAKEDVPF